MKNEACYEQERKSKAWSHKEREKNQTSFHQKINIKTFS